MKKFVALFLSLVMVAALAACGQSGAGSATTAAPAGGGDATASAAETTTAQKYAEQETKENMESVEVDEITYATRTATSLNGFGTRGGAPGGYEVYEMIYEADIYGEMQPFLADATYEGNFLPGCDHEPGTGVYTVHIYDYIKDHNGNDVTAEDVAFSYLHSLNEENTSGWKDNLLDVKALDPSTVEFTFAKEQTGVGQLLNVFCRCIIVDEDTYNNSPSHLNDEMIGTGPYKMESYTSGAELVLVRNDDYWQTNEEVRRQEQQANVKKLVYKFIDENSQKLIGLKTGELDLVTSLDTKDIGDFLEGGEFADKFNVFSFQDKMVMALHPNCSEKSLCGNKDFRLAVLNAIDLDGIIASRGGFDIKLDAYANSYYSDYDFVDWASKDNYQTKKAVDPAVVKDYLDKAGYQGETITLLGNAGMDDLANVIVNMLLQQGINAESKLVDGASFYNELDNPEAWDICLQQMAGDYNVTVWEHAFSFGNTSTKDHTQYWGTDQAWEDLLNECLSEEGHTPENMEKWWDMAVENGYVLALYASIKNDILPKNMTYYVVGDKNTALAGASVYE
ncbi:MAG: ABC transporter substrate-binding protein [Lachnospiraceae bacterium]|nr:ABC transporter substrate-binding protein [Lachnospiraceae bacterium]